MESVDALEEASRVELAVRSEPAALAEGARAFGAERDVVIGLGGAALFGLACAAGSSSLRTYGAALQVPLVLVATAMASIPSLAIGLALAGLDVDVRSAVHAAARGTTEAGRVLLGLSPLVLLYRATSAGSLGVGVLATCGLGVAGAFGLPHLTREFVAGRISTRSATLVLALTGFVVFSSALALRLWSTVAGVLFVEGV